MNSDDPYDSRSPSLNSDLGIIILAAGRSRRMRSALPKVLHPLAGVPVIEHVLRTAESVNPGQIVAVVGADSERIASAVGGRATMAVQPEPLGTADAVRAGLESLSRDARWVLVMNGDVPLISTAELSDFVAYSRSAEPLLSMMTFSTDQPGSYGRIERRDGRVSGVVEAADDNARENESYEVNSGVYCFDAVWLRDHIDQVPRSASGEYYLTSLVELAAKARADCDSVTTFEASEESLIGVDDRHKLAEAERVIRERINARHLEAGVTIVDPPSTYIDLDVSIEADVRVEPGCLLRGSTRIANGSVIGPYSVIVDSEIGEGAIIKNSWVESAVIGSGVHVGPFAHLRPGTVVEPDVHIGNYVETKQSTIGTGTRIGHFSYVGDATLGANVNVGAGTITCNYDGYQKHETIIGRDVFLGSDTMLVAPVEVGDGSRTGAGAVVTKSVPPGKTVVGVPARQITPARRTENEG